MNSKSKLWLAASLIIGFIGAVNYALINFFIWQTDQSLDSILIYNLFIFLALIFFAIISGWITIALGSKFTLNLSLLGQVSLSIYVIHAPAGIEKLVVAGVLSGLANALSYNSNAVLTNSLVEPGALVKFSSIKNSIWSLLSILVPFVVLGCASLFGYATALYIVIAIILIPLAFLFFLKVEQSVQLNYFPALIRQVFTTSQIRTVFIFALLQGISYSFAYGILNIIIFAKSGDLSSWSFISAGLAIVAIIVSYLLRDVKVTDFFRANSIYGIAALLLAFAPLLLLNSFKLEYLLLFLVVKTIFDKVNAVIAVNLLYKIEYEDENSAQKKVSYQMFNDFANAIGEFVVVLSIIFLPAGLTNTNTLIFILALVSLVPLLAAPLLKVHLAPFR